MLRRMRCPTPGGPANVCVRNVDEAETNVPRIVGIPDIGKGNAARGINQRAVPGDAGAAADRSLNVPLVE
jgi:hypothetical protein